MYNALGKINQNLEAVGATLGVSRIRIILDVILPQSRATLLEMGSYLFVNSMMTISAVSFLSTTATKPISLMINQFEAQMMLESAAFASLLILTTNVIIKLSVYAFKRHMSKKGVL
jgi:iron(III) transport system permease protein